jgi:hypothetical protein
MHPPAAIDAVLTKGPRPQEQPHFVYSTTGTSRLFTFVQMRHDEARVSNSIERNISYWTEQNAHGYADAGRRHWLAAQFTWGEDDLPESDIGALPDVAGKDVIELGCGTAFISAWLGVVGLDRSSASTRRRRSDGR